MSTREIRPAPPRSPLPIADDPDVKRRRRAGLVPQACSLCRRSKIKCDGARPKCSQCIGKGRQCGYQGEAGQTAQAALKSRLNTLEKILALLKSEPSDKANQLLERIRMTENVQTALQSLERGGVDEAFVESPVLGHATQVNTQSSNDHDTEPQSILSAIATPSTEGGSIQGLTTRSSSLQEDEQADRRATWCVAQVPLPDAAATKDAVADFFSWSEKLFHVFTQDQVFQFCHDVFHSQAGEKNKATICSLTALAAVGAQYRRGPSSPAQDAFYVIARYHFETVIESHPYDAIKVCVLLAMYNTITKQTVSLAYVELGLSLAIRFGLNTRLRCSPFSADSWRDYRKAWRTLVFLLSWLVCSLGYLSGRTITTEGTPLAEVELDDSGDPDEIVQTEMVRISLLKADILRTNLTFRDLTAPVIESVFEKLQDWYDNLPSQMHIGNGGRGDLPVEVRTSVYHAHLLHLGAIKLVYRRIVSQFVRSKALASDRGILPLPLENIAKYAEEGILAAKQSARILQLLKSDDLVFKRCWMVISQGYCSCTVLLHSAVQKQLHGLAAAEWQDDLQYAGLSLELLNYCAASDPIAEKLHKVLADVYDAISNCTGDEELETLSEGTENLDLPAGTSPMTKSAACLFDPPSDTQGKRSRVSLFLLSMLCRPFGGIKNKLDAEYDMDQRLRTDPTNQTRPQMIERLDWKRDGNLPFDWDFSKLFESKMRDGFLRPGLQGCFLDSVEPNGWAPLPDNLMGQVTHDA
ncbi:MAG: hypothetical protein LQ340_005099 [Diploschistes diacapsis]|nr:MAG: hypothetical protein LQ340_005099 [Diploschistes diacapsis]